MSETYRLGLRRAFSAEHALIGGDWGAENLRHGHDYLWEVRLQSDSLDRHGYLVDLIALEAALERVLAGYRGAFLNERSCFAGLNPSLERFARQLALDLMAELDDLRIHVESILWENEHAWASWSPE